MVDVLSCTLVAVLECVCRVCLNTVLVPAGVYNNYQQINAIQFHHSYRAKPFIHF